MDNVYIKVFDLDKKQFDDYILESPCGLQERFPGRIIFRSNACRGEGFKFDRAELILPFTHWKVEGCCVDHRFQEGKVKLIDRTGEVRDWVPWIIDLPDKSFERLSYIISVCTTWRDVDMLIAEEVIKDLQKQLKGAKKEARLVYIATGTQCDRYKDLLQKLLDLDTVANSSGESIEPGRIADILQPELCCNCYQVICCCLPEDV